eukprot:gnl/TRDRNA2_/TRDRNA2_158083_c1_seq3.p1 gnl/TRDRNA2_/TRDRNA2_158083_c1~~gnl/TRDRNA2_/TRDRNA2_158083_c1_seq3.p1  ORF type:complete len:182 (-),score=18.90 gnl/TRDRNA2_/TRDRNA2_158083_c1_seq3:4-549(-)
MARVAVPCVRAVSWEEARIILRRPMPYRLRSSCCGGCGLMLGWLLCAGDVPRTELRIAQLHLRKKLGLSVKNHMDLQRSVPQMNFPKGLKDMFSVFYPYIDYPRANMKRVRWNRPHWYGDETTMKQILYSGFDAFATLTVCNNIVHPNFTSWWQSPAGQAAVEECRRVKAKRRAGKRRRAR